MLRGCCFSFVLWEQHSNLCLLFQASRSFGRCSVCGKLKNAINAARAAHEELKVKELKQLIDRHVWHSQQERQENARRVNLADSHPTKYLHVYLDGADSGKSEVLNCCPCVFLYKSYC